MGRPICATVTTFPRLRPFPRIVLAVYAFVLTLGGWRPQLCGDSSGPRELLDFNGRYAQAPASSPEAIHRLVDAANRLQRKPYVWGGGHRYLYDRGYDCSGAASYVLHQAGLLHGPLTSGEFMGYGAPGPGRFVTIYAAGGHVFMSVCGLRFDTSDYGSGRGDGPRWRRTARNTRGYVVRHPPGL